METREDAIAFGYGSANTAFDQQREYGTLENSIASHRQNVTDTIAEYHLTEFETETLEAFDARINSLAETVGYEDLPVWQVTVLCPLEFRQRKHSVLFYQVVRRTEAEAIEAVRTAVINDRPYRGYRIIDCGRAGSSLTVCLQGATTRTPEQVADAPTL